MEITFLAKLNNYIATAFEKIAVIRTRQALISLDDRTLASVRSSKPVSYTHLTLPTTPYV